MNYTEIAEKLKSQGELNFVAFVKTPWHAIGVKSALLKIQNDENISLNGIILAIKQSNDTDNYLISPNDFVSNKNITYSFFTKSEEEFSKSKIINFLDRLKILSSITSLTKQQDKRKIFILNPLRPDYNCVFSVAKKLPYCNIISVITDEGAGSYMRTNKNWEEELKSNGFSFIQRKRIAVECNYFFPKMNKSLSENSLLLNFEMLEKQSKGFKVNENILPYFKNCISNGKNLNSNFDYYKNSVIINAQLYHEAGEIENDEDLKLYCKLIAVLNKNGFNVVLKPHPRERNINRYKSLNCKIETQNEISQEEIFNSLSVLPQAVLGFTTTTLLTSSLIFNVKSISLINLINPNSLSANLKNEFDNFKNAFSNIIKFPDDFEEEILNLN